MQPESNCFRRFTERRIKWVDLFGEKFAMKYDKSQALMTTWLGAFFSMIVLLVTYSYAL